MSNLISQRVIYSNNGSLTDISKLVANYRANSATIPFVAAEDYIFIGSLLPFNHKYIAIGTANDQSSAPSVDIWYGNAWISAVDILDFTDSSGVTLATDGILRFATNRLKGWDRELDSADVTGLTGTNIHNYYWVRLSFTADLNVSTAIKYIGHKFSEDDDLYTFYPDLNNSTLKSAFESGKTDWNEQHFAAAQGIIRELRSKRIIFERDQILDYELFNEASVHKTAQIIYGAFGQDYADDMIKAKSRFKEALNLSQYNLDENRDGRLSEGERLSSTRWFTR